jgi:hypothetical protein
MNTLIKSPVTKAKEVELVYGRIFNCKSIDDMGNITKIVDEFAISQPEEKEIIGGMRDIVCDMTFNFYYERYPQYAKK